MNKRERRILEGVNIDLLQPWYVGSDGGRDAVICAVCHRGVVIDDEPHGMYADRLSSAFEVIGDVNNHPPYCVYRQLVEAFKEVGL